MSEEVKMCHEWWMRNLLIPFSLQTGYYIPSFFWETSLFSKKYRPPQQKSTPWLMYSKCRGCTTMTASWSSNTHNTQRQTACGLFIFLSIDATTTCLNFFVNSFLHMYLLTSSADMVLCYIISSLVRIWYNIKPYPHRWYGFMWYHILTSEDMV